MKLPRLIEGLFGEIKPKRNNERYATDPGYRETRQKAAKTWNERHPAQKRANDKRWASQNGADASRRYRLRQRANTQ